ncbi:ferredoxin-dependent glutamate synthase-like, partial [Olea europaea var. sylvestris]|uniref:ferredoxin-dependent glutamate synthase-like n=1 Tax=Olea europaea var. sylvestris TaxID=158386 RepID=UPI000C1D6387
DLFSVFVFSHSHILILFPVIFHSDGKTVGACLDRNGLRPARYWRTVDNVVYVASEVGVLPTDDSKVIMKGRLGPGMMITVDLPSGQVCAEI